MIFTVSVSQFRQHLSDYIEKAKRGYTIVLKDEKRNEEIVQIMAKKKFDPKSFGESLRIASGIFTAQKNPEWKTKTDVISWLQKGRKDADRKF